MGVPKWFIRQGREMFFLVVQKEYWGVVFLRNRKNTTPLFLFCTRFYTINQ
jgi:hypothetical protein